jgi:hypothetical protein
MIVPNQVNKQINMKNFEVPIPLRKESGMSGGKTQKNLLEIEPLSATTDATSNRGNSQRLSRGNFEKDIS